MAEIYHCQGCGNPMGQNVMPTFSGSSGSPGYAKDTFCSAVCRQYHRAITDPKMRFEEPMRIAQLLEHIRNRARYTSGGSGISGIKSLQIIETKTLEAEKRVAELKAFANRVDAAHTELRELMHRKQAEPELAERLAQAKWDKA